MLFPMRLYPEDWQTRMPSVLAALFGLAASSMESFVFGPPNRGLGGFAIVMALGLLPLAVHDKDPRRSRRALILLAVLAPALHALVDPNVGVGEAYLRALREVPLGILAFFTVRALDRKIRSARPGVAA